MKVLNVNCYENKGGASIAVKQIHEALLENNIESKILVSEKNSNDKNIITQSNFFSLISFKFRERFNRNFFKILNQKTTNTQSSGLIRSYLPYRINNMNTDVVNLHWINNEMMSIKDLTRIKKPLVWTLHDLWPTSGIDHYTNEKNDGKSFIDNFIKKQKKKNWEKLFKIICPSTWILNKAKNSEILKNNEIKLIPHPIDIQKWKRINNKKEIKSLFNIDFNDNFKVLLFGAERATTNKRKGYQIALETAKKISEEKKIVLIIFGDDEKKTIKINDNLFIINLGYINDRYSLLRALYSLSDVMMVPSIEEAFGLTAAEASATGTPVVTLSGTGTEDIIQDNFNGFVTKEDNFTECVLQLLNSEEKWKTFSFNGKLHIEKKFHPSKVANEYIKVYQEIIF